MASTATATVESQELIQRFAKLGVWAGYSGAFCWAAMGVESVLRPWQDNRRDTFWMLPFVLTMFAFYCAHRVQEGRTKWEAPAFWTVMIASALTFLGSVGLQLNIASLKSLGFPGGAILWMLGLIAFGIGTWKAGVLHRSAALALVLLEPASILCALALSPIAPLLERGAYSGNIGKGAAVAIVASALQRLRRNPA